MCFILFCYLRLNDRYSEYFITLFVTVGSGIWGYSFWITLGLKATLHYLEHDPKTRKYIPGITNHPMKVWCYYIYGFFINFTILSCQLVVLVVDYFGASKDWLYPNHAKTISNLIEAVSVILIVFFVEFFICVITYNSQQANIDAFIQRVEVLHDTMTKDEFDQFTRENSMNVERSTISSHGHGHHKHSNININNSGIVIDESKDMTDNTNTNDREETVTIIHLGTKRNDKHGLLIMMDELEGSSDKDVDNYNGEFIFDATNINNVEMSDLTDIKQQQQSINIINYNEMSVSTTERAKAVRKTTHSLRTGLGYRIPFHVAYYTCVCCFVAIECTEVILTEFYGYFS